MTRSQDGHIQNGGNNCFVPMGDAGYLSVSSVVGVGNTTIFFEIFFRIMNSCMQCKSINAEIDVRLLIFLMGGGAYTRVIWGKRPPPPPGFWAQVHVQNEGAYTRASTVYGQ